MDRSYHDYMVKFIRNCQTVFQDDYLLYILPERYESSHHSISLSTFGIVHLFNCSNPQLVVFY